MVTVECGSVGDSDSDIRQVVFFEFFHLSV